MISYGDGLVLVNFVLTSLLIFLISLFKIPEGASKRLNFCSSRLFWQSDQHKKKYRPTKCNITNQGGLGIEKLEIKNSVYSTHYYLNYFIKKGCGKRNYTISIFNTKTLSQIQAKPTHSPVRKGLMGWNMSSSIAASLPRVTKY
jgi:hypothetical protein